jgi:Ca2+-binding EF-hand superfamily protein
MSELRKTFDRFDKDGSGFIEQKELTALLNALGAASRNDDAVLGALAQLKTARPGRVTFEEFSAWWEKVGSEAVKSKPSATPKAQSSGSSGSRPRRQAATGVDVRAVFDGFDRDKSGFIEARELAKVLEALGLEPDDDEVKVALKKLDTDGSGRLSWDEFSAWWDQQV